jgi:hypothetical protein
VAGKTSLVGAKDLLDGIVEDLRGILKALGADSIQLRKGFHMVEKGLARIAYVTDDRTTHLRERYSRIHDRWRCDSALTLGAGGAFGLGRRELFALNGSRKLALGNQQVSQEVEGCGRVFV